MAELTPTTLMRIASARMQEFSHYARTQDEGVPHAVIASTVGTALSKEDFLLAGLNQIFTKEALVHITTLELSLGLFWLVVSTACWNAIKDERGLPFTLKQFQEAQRQLETGSALRPLRR